MKYLFVDAASYGETANSTITLENFIGPNLEILSYVKMNKTHYGVMGMWFTTLLSDFQAKPS